MILASLSGSIIYAIAPMRRTGRPVTVHVRLEPLLVGPALLHHPIQITAQLPCGRRLRLGLPSRAQQVAIVGAHRPRRQLYAARARRTAPDVAGVRVSAHCAIGDRAQPQLSENFRVDRHGQRRQCEVARDSRVLTRGAGRPPHSYSAGGPLPEFCSFSSTVHDRFDRLVILVSHTSPGTRRPGETCGRTRDCGHWS